MREIVADLNARVMRKVGVSRIELLETIERLKLKGLLSAPYQYAGNGEVPGSQLTIASRSTITTTRRPRA